MKKIVLLLLCMGMVACGAAYYQATLANPVTQAPVGQGIEQAVTDRLGKPLDEVTLFPAVHQDHVVTITNQGATPCYFRTFVAFENSGNVFDRFITVNWYGFAATPVEGDLVIPGDANATPYRVCVVTGEKPLDPGATVKIMQDFYLSSAVDMPDIRPLGDGYSVLVATEAVWIPATDAEDYALVMQERINLLGPPTLQHALELFTLHQTQP